MHVFSRFRSNRKRGCKLAVQCSVEKNSHVENYSYVRADKPIFSRCYFYRRSIFKQLVKLVRFARSVPVNGGRDTRVTQEAVFRMYSTVPPRVPKPQTAGLELSELLKRKLSISSFGSSRATSRFVRVNAVDRISTRKES